MLSQQSINQSCPPYQQKTLCQTTSPIQHCFTQKSAFAKVARDCIERARAVKSRTLSSGVGGHFSFFSACLRPFGSRSWRLSLFLCRSLSSFSSHAICWSDPSGSLSSLSNAIHTHLWITTFFEITVHVLFFPSLTHFVSVSVFSVVISLVTVFPSWFNFTHP